MDVVLLERVVECASESSVKNCGREREGENEDAANGRDDGCGKGAKAREERGDTDKDFDGGGHHGDDVRDVQPFRSLSVGV